MISHNLSSQRRLPIRVLIYIFLIIASIFAIMHHYGITFDQIAKNAKQDNAISSYFKESLVQWFILALTTITVLLGLTQYRLMREKMALILGVALLGSGAIEIIHTLIINEFLFRSVTHDEINTITWTLSNTFSGLILFLGLLFHSPLFTKKRRYISVTLLTLFSIFTFLYHDSITSMALLNALKSYGNSCYIITYALVLIFLIPRIYKKAPNILFLCAFYFATIQMVNVMFILAFDTLPAIMKITTYFIPVVCLIINYTVTYNEMIEQQIILQSNQEKLTYIAARDPLTGLYNRREFEIILNRAIANSERFKDLFAVFLIDIDNFKSINDSLGHMQGDQLIKSFSKHLSSLTRTNETLSRIGGDEFVLITSKLQSPASTKQLANRILQGLNIDYQLPNHSLKISASIGIAIYPKDGDTMESLLKHADVAMYEAKKSGKNTFKFYKAHNIAQGLSN